MIATQKDSSLSNIQILVRTATKKANALKWQ